MTDRMFVPVFLRELRKRCPSILKAEAYRSPTEPNGFTLILTLGDMDGQTVAQFEFEPTPRHLYLIARVIV